MDFSWKNLRFSLDKIIERYIGNGNSVFSIYAKRDVKLTLKIPAVDDETTAVLINDTKITQGVCIKLA